MDANSTKIFSWKSAILLSVGIGLFTAGLSIFLQVRHQTVQGFSAADPKPVAAPAAVGLGSSFVVPGAPARLIIPKLNIDAAVKAVDVDANGDMQTPGDATHVAWYEHGPRPGMPGSAVINGHLDTKYVPQAVFYSLGTLVPGDLVEVTDNAGKTLQFRVVGSKTYDYNASTTDIFSGDASKARLNLITCAGEWDASAKLYNQRIVVFTELIAGN